MFKIPNGLTIELLTAIIVAVVTFFSLVSLYLFFIFAKGIVSNKDKNSDQKEKTEKELFEKPFLEQLVNFISMLDIDTSRFFEIVSGYRAAHYLNTGTFVHVITGSNNMSMQKFKDLFKEYYFDVQFDSDLVWRGFMMEKDDERIPEFIVSITHYDPKQPYAIIAIGDIEIVNKWKKYFLDTFEAPTIKKIYNVTGISKDGSLRCSTTVLEEDAKQMGHDEFYPYIEGGIKKLLTDYLESNESILLLFGPWGTGKSTLIRSLIMLSDYEHFGLCSNHQALETPEITGWMNNFDDKSMICLEDADNFIMSRERGNDKMSGLLNMADGVIRSGRKIIISTNLSNLNSVDEALTRSGRCFRIIKTRDLSLEEANIAREKIGLTALTSEDTDRSRLSLAEALNYDSHKNNAGSTHRGTGFLSKSA